MKHRGNTLEPVNENEEVQSVNKDENLKRGDKNENSSKYSVSYSLEILNELKDHYTGEKTMHRFNNFSPNWPLNPCDIFTKEIILYYNPSVYCYINSFLQVILNIWEVKECLHSINTPNIYIQSLKDEIDFKGAVQLK